MANAATDENLQGDINALHELHLSNLADDLITHHGYVVEYWRPFNNNREVNHNFVRGNQYDPKEIAQGRDKRKDLIVFNNIKASERTILGLWLQNRYDVEFRATKPQADDISEVLQQLDAWESDQQEDDMLDVEIVRQAWAGGNSFQECFMEVVEGKKPQMYTVNQNAFSICWDPESRELITRKDAQFVDRDSFQNYRELLERFPDKKKIIEDQLGASHDSDDGYEEVQVYADRDHEDRKERNGEYLVTERFYKVPGKLYFAEVDNMRIDIDKEDLKQFKAEMPGVPVQIEDVDELWLAIVCEEVSTTEYLYNGPYHCQPRDPRTKEIIWPILEMVAESLSGMPQGFVDHERDPSRVINKMITNILSSATHAAAAAMLIDPTAFISDTEARLAARHHADSDRSFLVKKGRTGDAMQPIAKSGVGQDHQYALDYSLSFLKEVTSTPPASMGQEEKAGVSGKLNEQRIQQGFTQLQPMMKNYRAFIKQRAKLRYYYWRTYKTEEETFRIIDTEEPSTNPFQTINKMVPEMDATGRWTGAIKKLNDINTAIYDIHIRESVKSPMYREKQLRFIDNLAQSNFIKNDPGLAGALLAEALRLSDAPEKTKENLKKYSTLIQKAEMGKRQAEQQLAQTEKQGKELDNIQKMQEIAQTEAQQTEGFLLDTGPDQEGAPASPQMASPAMA